MQKKYFKVVVVRNTKALMHSWVHAVVLEKLETRSDGYPRTFMAKTASVRHRGNKTYNLVQRNALLLSLSRQGHIRNLSGSSTMVGTTRARLFTIAFRAKLGNVR